MEDWKIGRLIAKRNAGVPLAYLTGHKEFYGLDFLVNKHTLIPRPDTEMLVQEVLNKISPYAGEAHGEAGEGVRIMLIDVGTGSGCIPIAIQSQVTSYKLQVTSFATDISKQALAIAKKNAKKHNADITFLCGHLLAPIQKLYPDTGQDLACGLYNSTTLQLYSHSIITANLPYLTEEQFITEPSIQHEPKYALVADNNGLALYEELLIQIKNTVSSYVHHVSCFMEIDPSQSATMTKLIQTHFPHAGIEIKKDLAGNDRVVCVDFS